MKRIGWISTGVLLLLGSIAPLYAQQEEAKPPKQEEKAKPEKQQKQQQENSKRQKTTTEEPEQKCAVSQSFINNTLFDRFLLREIAGFIPMYMINKSYKLIQEDNNNNNNNKIKPKQ